MITVRPPLSASGQNFNYLDDFMNQAGLIFVRGCEVEGMLDENGRVIEEGPEPKPVLKGESRSYRVLLGKQFESFKISSENITRREYLPVLYTDLT